MSPDPIPALPAALARLPHGPEFRFVDRLDELVPGRSGTGEYALRGDEPWLAGHFPGDPLMPGVLLLEAAAQLAGVVAQSDPAVAPLADLKLTGIQSAKITGTARPGETIRITASITARLGNLIQAEATARVDGRTVLVAGIVLAGRPAAPEAG